MIRKSSFVQQLQRSTFGPLEANDEARRLPAWGLAASVLADRALAHLVGTPIISSLEVTGPGVGHERTEQAREGTS